MDPAGARGTDRSGRSARSRPGTAARSSARRRRCEGLPSVDGLHHRSNLPGRADLLLGIVGDLGPYALLAGLFVVTAVFGQLISSMATALVVIPIAVAAGYRFGDDWRLGLPLLGVTFVVAVFLVPLVWPF